MSWRWLLLLVLPGGGCVLTLLVLRWLRRRLVTDPIDRLIVPPVQKFAGHDEALAHRTRARREHADRIKAEGRKLETRDDGRSRIHLVGER